MSVNKSKKTSPRKRNPGHGSQTITALFRKQIESSKKGAGNCSSETERGQCGILQRDKSNSASASTNTKMESDVEITEVGQTETKSKYFQNRKSKSPESSSVNSRSGKRLSLRKSVSKEFKDVKSFSNDSDRIKQDLHITHSASDCTSSDQLCFGPEVPGSSQKENDGVCEMEDKTKNRLSLRKRKSSEGDEKLIKKSKAHLRIETKETKKLLNEECSFTISDNNDKTLSTAKGKVCNENDTKWEQNYNSLSSDAHDTKEKRKNIETESIKEEIDSRDSKVKRSISSVALKQQENKGRSAMDDGKMQAMEENDDLADEDDNDEVIIRTPYYLENFRTIIKTVFADDDNVNLYNENDVQFITKFEKISESAQKLYVRLFCRKWAWLTMSKVKYPEIAEDLQPVIQELTSSGFLYSGGELTDLEKVLKLLPVPELKSFAKIYHLNISQNKKDMINSLIKKSKQSTIGSMFKVAGHNAYDIMLNRAKKVVGKCFCLVEEPRNVYLRTVMLFSLTDTILDDDTANGSSNQLFRMLQVNIGATVYPSYTVNKQTHVFTDRESFLRFAEASLMESELMSQLERNNFNGAYSTYKEAANKLESLKNQKEIQQFDSKLPPFLRPYTASSVYFRIMNQGVEILQRKKNYSEAVELLDDLLSQKTYCLDYRGHWWERLALNYDAHLKSPEKAVDAVVNGLADDHVKAGRRLALYLRADKICNSTKSKFKSWMNEIPDISVKEAPKINIEGTVLSDNVPGMKYKFIMADPSGSSGEDLCFCGVEELAMQHYKQNGYPEGLHAEGSIVSNLFGFFFWDIIFMDVPDAFHGPYQAQPLDMYSSRFYLNRKKDIDKQLKLIAKSHIKDLQKMVAKVWEDHNGEMCVGINWERFNSLEHAQGLVSCIGGNRLSKILKRYVKEPRHTRSGFPDLTMWNTDSKTVKISEVKGPGDRLSHKQILWLDYLVDIGIDAEVCYVKAVGSKKLKPTSASK